MRLAIKIRLVLAVLAVILALALPMLLKKDASPEITSGRYSVTDKLYSAPMYDFDYTSPDSMPAYSISDSGELFERGALFGDVWHSYGTLEKVAFDKAAFLSGFMDYTGGATLSGFDPGAIAERTVHAWRAEPVAAENDPAVFILLLRLDDGSDVLAYGYRNEFELIRWVFAVKATGDAPAV